MSTETIDQEAIDALPAEERYDKIYRILRDTLGDDDRWLLAAVDRTVWELVAAEQERWGMPAVVELLGSQPQHVLRFLESYGLQTEHLGLP